MGNPQEFLTRLAAADLLPDATLTKLQASPQVRNLDAKRLAEELVRRKLISVYQARALLTQREPKFHYGPYQIVGRHTAGFRAGLFEALHRPTKHPVEMVEYLQKSWQYRPYSPIEAIIKWVEYFAEYATYRGLDFDAYDLTSSPEWHKLIEWVMTEMDEMR